MSSALERRVIRLEERFAPAANVHATDAKAILENADAILRETPPVAQSFALGVVVQKVAPLYRIPDAVLSAFETAEAAWAAVRPMLAAEADGVRVWVWAGWLGKRAALKVARPGLFSIPSYAAA